MELIDVIVSNSSYINIYINMCDDKIVLVTKDIGLIIINLLIFFL